MKRSTSYFATASAMRWVPSTWTSSYVKFLSQPSSATSSHNQLGSSGRENILCGVVTPNQVEDDVRMPHALLNRRGVSQIKLLHPPIYSTSIHPLSHPIPLPVSHGVGKTLTINTIFPKSPVTFRWRFVISSRYGITTVHPALAILPPSSQPHTHTHTPISRPAPPLFPPLHSTPLQDTNQGGHTEFVDNISPEESRRSENSDGVAYPPNSISIPPAIYGSGCYRNEPPTEDLYSPPLAPGHPTPQK